MSRIVIAGAGIAGLSAALQFIERGHDVTLLERGDVGRESSWAGGGILCPLLPWDYGEALTALALRSMDQYGSWIEMLEARSSCATEYWRCGLEIRGMADVPRALAWCGAHGFVADVDPNAPDRLYLPSVAQVRNPRLVDALRAAVERAGGRIQTNSAVDTIERQARRVDALVSREGRHSAEIFIWATGAWAALPLPQLAAPPTVRPIKGQMLLFRLAPGALATILFKDGVYLIPRRDGHVLVGSTLEDAGFDKSTDAPTLDRLQQRAGELLPALAAQQPVRHWAGLRPGAPDNVPLIDRHPDFDNLYVTTGQYRYGVTLAPASAELLADMVHGVAGGLDPRPYSWDEARKRQWSAAL